MEHQPPPTSVLHAAAPRGGWSRPARLIPLLGLLVLFRGLLLLCIMPPMEAWDEYQHVAYVEHLRETGVPPVYGRATVPPTLLREVVRLPLPPEVIPQLQGSQARSYAQYWKAGPATPPVDLAPVVLYQAQHSPLYYRLVEPFYVLAGGTENLRNSTAILRLVNLLSLVAATVVFALTVHRLSPDHPTFVWTSIALSLNPMLLLNSVRVANDASAVLAASAAMFCGACLVKGRSPIVMAILTGATATMAIWCKTTSLALVLFAVACIWLRTEKRGTVSRGLVCLVTLAVIAIGLWPSVQASLALHGVPFPSQEAIVARERGMHLADYLKAATEIDWLHHLPSWWNTGTLWIGGWSRLRLPGVFKVVYGMLILLGLASYAAGLWARRSRMAAASATPLATAFCLAACLGYTGTLVLHAISGQLAWGGVVTNSWYAAPAIPAFLFLLVLGFRQSPFRVWARRSLLLLLLVYALAELLGVLVLMPRQYAQTSLGVEAMHRLAMMQPAWLGTPTLLFALAAELTLLAIVARLAWRTRWEPLPPAPSVMVNEPAAEGSSSQGR